MDIKKKKVRLVSIDNTIKEGISYQRKGSRTQVSHRLFPNQGERGEPPLKGTAEGVVERQGLGMETSQRRRQFQEGGSFVHLAVPCAWDTFLQNIYSPILSNVIFSVRSSQTMHLKQQVSPSPLCPFLFFISLHFFNNL